MAIGKKTGGRDWKKGAGGPGRPATPPDIKEVAKLTRSSLEALMASLIALPLAELTAYKNREDITVLEALIVSVVHKALIGGDHQRLDFLLNRLVGKVADKIERVNPVSHMSPEEKLAKAEQLVRMLKGQSG